MASVFLSYDREDFPRAKSLAQALENAGHSVWWDRHIKGGAQYSKEIEQALTAAEAVVVLWSKHSVDSAWVRDEAAAGRDSGRLVPVAVDTAQPPLGFRQYQTIDLSRWRGRGNPTQLQTLCEAVDALGSGTPKQDAGATPRPDPTRPALARWALPIVAIILIALVGLIFWRPWNATSSVPVIAVAASDNSATTSGLARDLFVQLGSLQSANSDAFQLVEQSSDQKPDLIFEVDGSRQGDDAQANLVLLKGKEHALLWSKNFNQPVGKEANLRLQLAYTAARVLGCATEALGAEGRKIDQPTLKLFLNACAKFAEIAGSDPRPVIPVLLQIIAKASTFRPAWAMLLVAEADGVQRSFNNREVDKRALESLRNHIALARKLDRDMPEIAIAELSLLPPGSYVQALELIDNAILKRPDNLSLLNARSNFLREVGRMDEAIEDAKRAAELDPLSPVKRNGYISALAYAGKIDAAREELQRAERLWPGTDTLRDVQYRFHLRYGDPKQALKLAKPENLFTGLELFLIARADPSKINVDRLVTHMEETIRRRGQRAEDLSFAAQALGEFRREDALYEHIFGWPRKNDLRELGDILFRPALHEFRRDPRFMQIAAWAGLLDYWRTTGKWPDFCFESDLPYDCKKEAAKIA